LPDVGATVMLTVATVPLPIAAAFKPVAKHVYTPEIPLQYKDLPAAVRTGPGAAVMAVTDEIG
jgi:hypothetical protein